MQFGSWKKVWMAENEAFEAHWKCPLKQHVFNSEQGQKERIISKLTANLNNLPESLPSTNSSKVDIGNQLESLVKHASSTVASKKLESKDLGSLESVSFNKGKEVTLINVNDFLMKEQEKKRSQISASSLGPNILKRSANTEGSDLQPETSKLKFMYSGESLAQEKLDSLSSLQIILYLLCVLRQM